MMIRVASWNVRGLARPAAQLNFLGRQGADLLLLQDVTEHAADAVRNSGCWHSVLRSRHDGGRQRAGCLIATGNGWDLGVSDAVAGVPDAERTLTATARHGDLTLTVACCYAPTNTGRSATDRPAFFTAVAAWLAAVPTPLLLGMDANGPRVDHPDLMHNVWWSPEEEQVLGASAVTCDALRLWFDGHPEQLALRRRYYPHGPLADSYHRGRRGRFLRCRYDSIRVSPGIRPLSVRYFYDEAVAAGSDHALVIAELELPPAP